MTAWPSENILSVRDDISHVIASNDMAGLGLMIGYNRDHQSRVVVAKTISAACFPTKQALVVIP